MVTAMEKRTYTAAIQELNSCQTGFAALEAKREIRRQYPKESDGSGLKQMRDWLRRIGYQPRDLDRLNVVHVTGTKGKGTTCAYVDSILRQCSKSLGRPKKVGLYTSPHLISVRERIRIDSEPISEGKFARYFFEVWDALERSAREEGLDPSIKPPYFRFLTLMSFHVFIQEGVDCAVYETGVGGEYDSTNIIERPIATGISTLGVDHVKALGETVDKIAWHKAGIFKNGTRAFSVRQVEEAVPTLRQRAEVKGVDLQWVDINPALYGVKIQSLEDFQRNNASLAIALSFETLAKFGIVGRTNQKHEIVLGFASSMRQSPVSSVADSDVKDACPPSLPQEFVQGLEAMVWRGRCEILTIGKQRYYLDGAHMEDSLQLACRWFAKTVPRQQTKVLIFNQQSTRVAVSLMRTVYQTLQEEGVEFEHVIFCTNATYKDFRLSLDFVNRNVDPDALSSLSLQKTLCEEWSKLDTKANVEVLPTIEDVLNYVKLISEAKDELGLFVTGSLHLVGGMITILEGKD